MEKFLDLYVEKKIGFVGAGVSNLPIIELFLEKGIDVTLRDKKDSLSVDAELINKGLRIIKGDKYLEDMEEDIIFLSPALRPDLPEFIKARESGVLITTELEEFLKHCPCTTIGITGSDGKTTTSTLCAKLLESSGKKVYLGGNIGENLFVKLSDIKESDFAVIEISSFQLMKMRQKPDISIITNISPNHLDWHTDMNEYINAKKRIISDLQKRTILNGDDKTTSSFEAKNKILFGQNQKYDFYFDSEGIKNKDGLILKNEDILLPGIHNKANYTAAISAVFPYISKEAIIKVAKNFGGVEHRIELVDTINGVTYYNSSIDSSPTRTAAALNSFDEKLIVISGGYDKKIPLEPLGELFERKAKAVITMGTTGPMIKKILTDNNYSGKIFEASSMKEAVDIASRISDFGDKVILSPAAASFDMYTNFVSRGRDFKNKVKELK